MTEQELIYEISRLRDDLKNARTERDQAYARISDLEEEIDEWKSATMLDGPGGDPARITPDHLRQFIQDIGDSETRLSAEVQRLQGETEPLREMVRIACDEEGLLSKYRKKREIFRGLLERARFYVVEYKNRSQFKSGANDLLTDIDVALKE